MAVSAAQIVVTTATALNTASQDGTYLAIKNGSAVIALGPSTVAIGTGRTVAVSGEVQVWLKPGDVLYAVCATTSTVEVLRT